MVFGNMICPTALIGHFDFNLKFKFLTAATLKSIDEGADLLGRKAFIV
jgi:hypothetical protein